jgi:hypothetical protein
LGVRDERIPLATVTSEGACRRREALPVERPNARIRPPMTTPTLADGPIQSLADYLREARQRVDEALDHYLGETTTGGDCPAAASPLRYSPRHSVRPSA